MRKLLASIVFLSVFISSFSALAERFVHKVNANGKCLVYITYVRGNESETSSMTCKEFELSEKIYEQEMQKAKKLNEIRAGIEQLNAERQKRKDIFDQKMMDEGIHVTIAQLHDGRYMHYPDKNIEFLNELLSNKDYLTVYSWWDFFNMYQLTRMPEDRNLGRNEQLMIGVELFMNSLMQKGFDFSELTSWRFEKIKNECGKTSVVYIVEIEKDSIPYSFGFRKKENQFPFAVYNEKELSGPKLPGKCNNKTP